MIQQYEPKQTLDFLILENQFEISFFADNLIMNNMEETFNLWNFDLLQLILLDIIRNLLAFHIFQPTVKYDHHQAFLYFFLSDLLQFLYYILYIIYL